MSRYKNIVVLTGAGISAESGIKTFRDQNGLWENHRIEEVASPEGFERNPNLVQHFYNLRRQQLFDAAVAPNAAHDALAEFEQKFNGSFLLVTQNVDNLHERAGSANIIHMHGELLSMLCQNSGERFSIHTVITADTTCVCCGLTGSLRPDIVWFGEMPYEMDAIYEALSECDLFMSIGTSGHVYPAAGFVEEARRTGAHTIEVNMQTTQTTNAFAEHHYGLASATLPKLLNTLLET